MEFDQAFEKLLGHEGGGYASQLVGFARVCPLMI